jgi:hypothetical protein
VSVRRDLFVIATGAFLSLSTPAGAQPVAIQHQDVACLVAGKFPILDACFRPGPGLARARVYFRPEGVTNWYYVEASSPAPIKVGDPGDLVCRRATLPKPKKSLLKKKVDYYLEATGRGLESSQTETFSPLVVAAEGDCKLKLVAPWVPTAVVQVFPSLPATFAVSGGLGGAAVAAVVGAGVAGTTATVVAVTNNDPAPPPPSTEPPVATLPVSTTFPPAPSTTTTTTTVPGAPFNPVFKVFNGGVLETGPRITGTEPLKLRFVMCETTGPFPLKFNVLVGGETITAGCDTTITFTTSGAVAGSASGRGAGEASSPTTYSVLMQVRSDGPGNNPQDSRPVAVEVDVVPPTTTTTTSTSTTTTSTTSTTTSTTTTSTTTTSTSTSTTTTTTTLPCAPPSVRLLSPKDGEVYTTTGQYPINFTSSAAATPPALIDKVEYYLQIGTSPAKLIGTSTTSAGNYPVSFSSSQAMLLFDTLGSGFQCMNHPSEAWALAYTTCGSSEFSSPHAMITVGDPDPSCPRAGVDDRPAASAAPAAWTSQLEIPGARGQVVVNGRQALFPGPGRVALAVPLSPGENRVEAQLVQAEGKAGLWRFELRDQVPGSLRVIAGQVALVTGDAVVFRLGGRAGERVVFTFRYGR